MRVDLYPDRSGLVFGVAAGLRLRECRGQLAPVTTIYAHQDSFDVGGLVVERTRGAAIGKTRRRAHA